MTAEFVEHDSQRAVEPHRAAPSDLYRFENGAIYRPPGEPQPPFVPDQGFDFPA